MREKNVIFEWNWNLRRTVSGFGVDDANHQQSAWENLRNQIAIIRRCLGFHQQAKAICGIETNCFGLFGPKNFSWILKWIAGCSAHLLFTSRLAFRPDIIYFWYAVTYRNTFIGWCYRDGPKNHFSLAKPKKCSTTKAKRIIEWFFVLISQHVSLSAAKLFINLGDIFLRKIF